MRRRSRFAVVAALVVQAGVGALLADSAGAQIPTNLGWTTVPSARISNVCAGTNGFSGVLGVEGCFGILSWSGAVFDTTRNRLIIHGGGHNAYYGNELYAFNLSNLTLTRLNNPGLPAGSSGTCQEAIASGTQANTRHTYDGIEYMPNVDRMFVFSGSLACSSGNFGSWTWTFDFANMRWQNMSPSGPIPKAGPGILTAYDPNTGNVVLHDLQNLYSYNPITNAYTRLSPQRGFDIVGYHMVAAIDPKRRKFVIIGWSSVAGSGRVYMYDLNQASPDIQTLSTTGGGPILADDYPGIEYDPVTDRLVAWNGGNTVYSLNLDTREWTTTTFTGGPGSPSASGRGTHGRWRYSPASNVFVLVNEYDQPTYIFRLTTGGTVPPAAPTAVQLH